MTARLTGGVVPAPHERVLPPGADRPGQPVAVGPAEAGEAPAAAALERLRALVDRAGVVAADAGVDLGGGFRSARIEGGAGNRRDGMLAALRVLGAEPLGAPAAVSVALFGIEATKPLGAAAARAVADGRWAALRFAVAAAEVLGPEQLVRLLEVTGTEAARAPEALGPEQPVRLLEVTGTEAARAPDAEHRPGGDGDDADPFPDGLPSVVGEHLRQVLEAVPRARRPRLLLSLWDGVCAHLEARRRTRRRRETQARVDRRDDLRARYEVHSDDEIVDAVRRSLRREPSVADAARWSIPQTYRHQRATGVLHDCLAATVLLRLAVSVADTGTAAALVRHRDEITAAGALLDEPAVRLATRAVPGLTGLPARPGVILRGLERRLRHPSRDDDAFVRNAIANARAYGRLALEHADDLLYEMTDEPDGRVRKIAERWAARSMDDWREKAGPLCPGRAAGWWQPPLFATAESPSIGHRIARGEPVRETIGDLVWLAELGDALARLGGDSAAVVEYGRVPQIVYDVPAAEESPLAPRWDSIALVAGGTAQLAGLAGLRDGAPAAAAARRARGWGELISVLQGEAAVVEALTGSFALPDAILAADGAVLPGGGERIEIALTPRRTAEWGAYMGNCIGAQWHTADALAGRAFLVAVRTEDRILLNADLRPTARGWRIQQLRARFNQDPEPELAERFRAWVATLPPPPDPGRPRATEPPAPRHAPEPARQRRGRVRTPAGRISAEHAAALGSLADSAVRSEPVAAAVSLLARLTDGTAGDGVAAMTALRRMSPAALVRAVAAALEAGDPAAGPAAGRAAGRAAGPAGPAAGPAVGPARDGDGLTAGQVWLAGGVRPLGGVLADYGVAELAPLALDEPLAGALRTVAKAPGVAEARTVEVVSRRVRRAAGTLLRGGSPVLAGRRPEGIGVAMLCACALAVTSWAGPGVAVAGPRRVTVPGFPASALHDEDGPWQAAWPDAVELGADRDVFWERIAEHGLLVPAAWVGAGGWVALWTRAHRQH
ncbi:hypothetical protein ABT369_25010 [Dactylosporangium sp. NPDC000244]|uniref:hypothetical protein n=1 Tax=Dactylosporangium sp. NPDC000244 TaxID=3154365 RepID=UPI003334311E